MKQVFLRFRTVFGLGFAVIFSFSVVSLAYAQVPDDVPLAEQLQELRELEQELDGMTAELDAFESSSDLPDVLSKEIRANVTEILAETDEGGVRHMVFVATAGEDTFTVDTSQSYLEGLRYPVRVGDDVYLQLIYTDGVLQQAFLVDVVRTPMLLLFVLVFSIVILAIGRLRGLAALFGLALTLAILFGFIVPQILAGRDPVIVTVMASIVILAVNMHLSHGFHKQTFFAFFGTTIGLGLVWMFSTLFVTLARLSGMASEESVLLQYHAADVASPSGILLAAIILGAVGVLDDIAITQSETVAELRAANPALTNKELFQAAMRVGRHHIASTVNTLVLAYAGVALPLLLLVVDTQGVEVGRFLNEEPVSEEIVRTLAGTLGLVLTVPIATWLATYAKKR